MYFSVCIGMSICTEREVKLNSLNLNCMKFNSYLDTYNEIHE